MSNATKGDPTQASIEELKGLIASEGLDISPARRPEEPVQIFLTRFLRARGNNVAKALKMLTDDVDWRREMGVDALRNESALEVLGSECDPDLAHQCLPTDLCGHDTEGRPVIYVEGERFDVAKLVEYVDMDHIIRFHVWRREKLVSRVLEEKGGEKGSIAIVDIAGMTLGHVTRDFLAFSRRSAGVDQDHYPERLATIYMINVPAIFPYVWAMIKPCVDPRTRNKMHFISGDPGPELIQRIGAAGVPEKYGGSARPTSSWDCTPSLPPSPSSQGRRSFVGLSTSGTNPLFHDADEHQRWENDSDKDGAASSSNLSNVGSIGWKSFNSIPPVTLSSLSNEANSASDLQNIQMRTNPLSVDLVAQHEAKEEGMRLQQVNGDINSKVRAEDLSAYQGGSHTTPGSRIGTAGEEGALETFMRVKKWLDIANLLLFIAACGLVTGSSLAWANFRYWAGEVVEWVGWIGLAGVFLGLATILQVGVGVLGRRLFSRAILHMYVMLITVTFLPTLALGLICIPYYFKVDTVIRENWSAIQDLDQDAERGDVEDTLRRYMVMSATLLMTTAAFMLVPYTLSIKMGALVPTSQQTQDLEIEVCAALLRMHRWASAVAVVFGLSGLSYGVFATNLALRYRNDLFLAYSATALGAAVVVVAVFSLLSAQRQFICYGKVFAMLVHSVLPILLIILVLFAVACYSALAFVKDNIHGSWDSIQAEEEFQGQNETQVIAMVKRTLMVMGTLMLSQASCIGFLAFNALKTQNQFQRAGKVIGFDPMIPNAELFMNASKVCLWRLPSPVDSTIIMWGLVSGAVQIFWEGQFVLFSDWIADNNNERNRWFLAGWYIYGEADARYLNADSFVVSMELIATLVVGPMYLTFAWAVYTRNKFRDIIGVFVCTIQIHAGVLYFVTAIHSRDDNVAAVYEPINFWVLFIFTNLLRFAVPIPIAIRSCWKIAQIVQRSDYQNVTGSKDEAKVEPLLRRTTSGRIVYDVKMLYKRSPTDIPCKESEDRSESASFRSIATSYQSLQLTVKGGPNKP